ncbi:sulfite:cytochrome C oxidoreductase subunit B [Bordetella genomosp. 1]|uniref:Sulfite:cytochrome C oxidoreductase subunit B n=1 Tax=Bordetella genomosp. 1 TaxID=1395607 RepID=A0A261S5T9_9BORD|nr:sulfite:cytochrome C oxidoreductase subunit B [Bordetella genomosp. 1]OZI32706.1 sulfite:cytochrome C oxidoreductase subunit B [Bordetella genomosp. 1]
MRFSLRRAGIVLALLLPVASAGALEIQLPTETAMLRPAATGADAAAPCMMCHSVDYLSTQPPMLPGFWQAEVRKMVDAYGAPLSAEQLPGIVEYLDAAYPPAVPEPVR